MSMQLGNATKAMAQALITLKNTVQQAETMGGSLDLEQAIESVKLLREVGLFFPFFFLSFFSPPLAFDVGSVTQPCQDVINNQQLLRAQRIMPLPDETFASSRQNLMASAKNVEASMAQLLRSSRLRNQKN